MSYGYGIQVAFEPGLDSVVKIKLLNDYTFETFSIGFYQEREAS